MDHFFIAFLSPPQCIKQPDIKTMQTNEMELGAPKRLWIEDDNHQLK